MSKWIGHRAYIEVSRRRRRLPGARAGRVRRWRRPPMPSPIGLVAEMLDDPTIVSPDGAGRADTRRLFSRLFAEWLAEPRVRARRRGGSRGDRQSRCSSSIRRPTPAATSRRGEFSGRLAALDARQQADRKPARAAAPGDGPGRRHGRKRTRLHSRQPQDAGRRSAAAISGGAWAARATRRRRRAAAGSSWPEQMVSPDNPLLPRVIVNRLWQHHFGEGHRPLARRFRRRWASRRRIPNCSTIWPASWCAQGWSLKQMHRLMVLSSTYRMSSQPQPRGRSGRSAEQAVASHARAAAGGRVRFATRCWPSRAGLDRDACTVPSVMPYLTDLHDRPRPARRLGPAGWRRPAQHLPGACGAISSRRCCWPSTIRFRSRRSAGAACRTCRPRR